MVRTFEVATASSLDRYTAPPPKRSKVSMYFAIRPTTLHFSLLSVPNFLLVSDPPLVGYSLSPNSLPPAPVLALFILHGDQRVPRTSFPAKSRFKLARLLPPATGAPATMLSGWC